MAIKKHNFIVPYIQAAYTNKNTNPGLPPAQSFVVKQWRAAHAIIAIVIYLIVFAMVYNVIVHGKPGTDMPGIALCLIFVLVAIPSTVGAFSKKIYIEINKTGIYTRSALLTAWQDFIAADYYEKASQDGTASVFILRIQHHKQGIGDFEANIPMESTLTKSPEEVIAAIKHFYGAWKENAAG